MSKPQKSKLDPHAESLVSMEIEGKTLPEMIVWLRGEGVTVAASTLSDFLSARRSARREQSILQLIATGAQQRKQVAEAFAKNPVAEVQELIDLHKALSYQLATEGVDNPEMLKLADQMTNTVLNYLSGQTKAAHKEREVTLAEQKALEAKKEDGAKALEYALEESKGTPAEELFRQAFAALKKAKGLK